MLGGRPFVNFIIRHPKHLSYYLVLFELCIYSSWIKVIACFLIYHTSFWNRKHDWFTCWIAQL